MPSIVNSGVSAVLPGTDVSVTGSAEEPVVNAGALLTTPGGGLVGGPQFVPASITQTGAPAATVNYTPAAGLPVGDDDRSYEFMFRYHNEAIQAGLFQIGDDSISDSGRDMISWNDPTQQFSLNGTQVTFPTLHLFDGNPHLMQLVYSSPTWTLYVDNVLIGTFTTPGRSTPSSSHLYLGYDQSTGGGFAGEWQNVAVYPHKLSPAEIADHWAKRANQAEYVAAVVADAPATFWQLSDALGSAVAVDTMGALDLPYTSARLQTQAIFATGSQPAPAPVPVAKLSPTSPYFDGQKPTRAFNANITNGARRRLVTVSVDVKCITGSAYCGFTTTAGQESLAVADMVGVGTADALSNPLRLSYAFAVDPGAVYQITDDLTGDGTATLIAVVEYDF